MKKNTVIWLYILSAYVIMQFGWWAYHLIDLASIIEPPEKQRKQIIMIIGEGLVFFLLLILGIWQIRRSFQKEILISNRQSNFLLSVTHELKTPIASSKLYLQTLLKRHSLDRDQQEKLLEKALEENRRLEVMIENILTATQIENQHFKLNITEHNLSNEIAEIAENWSKLRVPIKSSIEKDIVRKVDLSIIETALLNLLENAYKYGGTNPEIEVYLKKEGNNVIWGVKDQGSGIPPEHSKEIFEKFVRIGDEVTRKQKGTGLGLFIVKSLLVLHGDKIEYLSNTPKGSHFKITRSL
ncbi:MAG: ATP-binding protein [Brumimicrobium sp.]